MRGRQRADNQPVHPIGTMLSGYSPFGGTPPPPQTHPAMAKIIIQPGIKSAKFFSNSWFTMDGPVSSAVSTVHFPVALIVHF